MVQSLETRGAAKKARIAAEPAYARRERVKQLIGRALLVAAIVMMFWSMKDTLA